MLFMLLGCELPPTTDKVPFTASNNGHVLMVHWTQWAQQNYYDINLSMVDLYFIIFIFYSILDLYFCLESAILNSTVLYYMIAILSIDPKIDTELYS
jgi:hypothetical protein